jgi:hypothetical protein
MELEETIKTLEAEKVTLTKKLKTLKLKETQVLKIKQLKDDIAKLNSDIKSVKIEVEE